MASFDYITSADLRRSLESDYSELRRCSEASAAKAVHVLAGSIVEALLADLLISIEVAEEDDVYRMSFSELVDRSRAKGLVSQKVADLSSAIRGYRNLIHPGRSVRTAEAIDEHSSQIALSLVELIAKEVAAERKKAYGLTAEQVVGKLEKDTSAVAIAEHLLAGVRPQELERLLLRTIPERHAEIEDPFDDLDAALQRTFDIAYQKADRVLRARIARDYDRRLREDSQPVIEHYDLNFFRMDFLDHLDDAVATMVRQHLIGVLPGLSTYNRISSLGARVHPTEVDTFVDALVRKATFPREPRKRTQAEKYLNDELAGMPDKLLTLAVRRLQAWKRMFEKKDQTAYENVMRRALGEEEKFDPDADDALPF